MKRTAIVTGGTRGIGRGISTAFLREGVNVTAAYRTDREAAESLAREADDLEGELVTVQADVGDADGADRVVETTVAKWGRVDFLVNNAAVCGSRSWTR